MPAVLLRPTLRRAALVTIAVAGPAAGLLLAGAPPAVAVATRDVPVTVPARFLGGPIGEPLPTSLPLVVGRSADPARAGCGGTPALDCLVIVGSPDALEEIPLPDPGPSSGLDTADDDPDTPHTPGTQAEQSLSRPEDSAAFGGLAGPTPGGWLRGPSARLRWTAWSGAAFYVTQVQRGPRLIASARTRSRTLTLPARSIWMGRTFGWAVWAMDAAGRPMNGGEPLGSSVFGVFPRLRAVLRATARGRVTGEVRPHVPGGVLRIRLSNPGATRAVRLDRHSRFSVALPSLPRAARQKVGLDSVGLITLIARGPRPPLGLWR
jgi:hypothetical protein